MAALLAAAPVLLLGAGLASALLHSGEISRSLFRLFRFVLLVEVALLVILAVAGAIYQARSNASDERQYPPPGKLVDVGGYRLHLYCTGAGGPTVVLDFGLSGSYLDWYFVQPEVARFTRVCSWDRSGYGWSERSPRTQVPSQIAAELHTLLERAGEKPPFILVGHSLGAFDVRMYAHRYPEQVAGVVLVDGSHPDEEIPFTRRSRWELRLLQFTAPFGLPRWRRWCAQGPKETRPMQQAFACRSRVFRAHYEQWSVFRQSTEEVRKLGSLGDLPLAAISRDPNRAGNQSSAREQGWQQRQQELVRLSSNSFFTIAAGSSHAVGRDRPDVVVEGIRRIVEAVRRKESTTKDTKG